MERFLRIALAKGRIAQQALDLLEGVGMECDSLKGSSRRLIARDLKGKVEFILAKASDVAKYVERGAVDMGVVGKDTLMEQQPDLYEVLDLGIGRCRMVVAGKPDMGGKYRNAAKVVATKYPNIATNFFREKGEGIEVVKLDGSVELAPLIGLADVIVDLVETGRTLKENGLVVLEEICPISARLVVNKVSLRVENQKITGILKELRKNLRKTG